MARANLRVVAEAEEPDRDGRRRRSQDSRARIVRAMLELVQAGDVTPCAEDVAAQADVGLRTVFRQFKDMDSLYREMVGAVEGELAQTVEAPLQGAGWRERLMEIATRRTEVYERIAPFKRAAEAHRHRSTFLQASQARTVALGRARLEALLPPELARDRDRLEAIDLLLSFEAWSRLRREQGLSARRASEVIHAGLIRLLA